MPIKSYSTVLLEGYLSIPADWKTTWTKKSGVGVDKQAKVAFAYVPLSKLSAAGRPSEAGEHVYDMIKVLKKKKLQPVVVQYKNGKYEVLDGNTRVLALKLMGATGKIPATVVTWEKAFPNLELF